MINAHLHKADGGFLCTRQVHPTDEGKPPREIQVSNPIAGNPLFFVLCGEDLQGAHYKMRGAP